MCLLQSRSIFAAKLKIATQIMVQDFFMAALPWIVMGLSAGIILGAVAAAAKAKNEGKN